MKFNEPEINVVAFESEKDIAMFEGGGGGSGYDPFA